jgi:hypothetical protein
MRDNVTYITATGAGDKQTGFYCQGLGILGRAVKTISRKGCPEIIPRGFFYFTGWRGSLTVVSKGKLVANQLPPLCKRYSFKRSFLYRLRVDKRIENKKQALLAPATCTMINVRRTVLVGSQFDSGVLMVQQWFESTLKIVAAKRFDSPEGSSPSLLSINGLYKRVMAFFASCEQLRYSKRFDSWNGNRSTLTLHMGGDYRSWGKVQ